MLEEVVKVITKKIISSDYPHLKTPSVVFARIDSVKICGTFEADDLTIADKSLVVIDRFGNVNNNFPVLPGIKSKKPFQAGAVVAIAFAYGDIEPVIIGEVSL